MLTGEALTNTLVDELNDLGFPNMEATTKKELICNRPFIAPGDRWSTHHRLWDWTGQFSGNTNSESVFRVSVYFFAKSGII